MAFSGVRSSWRHVRQELRLVLAGDLQLAALLLRPAGTGGRSRSPGPTGWRTSGAGRRPAGGTRRASCGGSPACRRSAARAPAGRRSGRGSRPPEDVQRARHRSVARPSAMSGTWTAGPAPGGARRPRCRSPRRGPLCVDRSRAARPAYGTRPGGRTSPVGLVELVDRAAVGLGEPGGVRDDGGEHLLEVERRGDRLADLAEGLQLADTRPAAPRTTGRSRWRSRPGPRTSPGARSRGR